jgi:hypothetical protein
MGIFYDMATVINLAPVTLNVTFDGQTLRIPPGESVIPKVTLSYAKNQNPVPGSADMDNPHISGAQYLISVKGSGDRQEPFTKEEWEAMAGKPSRWNTEDYFADTLDPKDKVITRGKGRKTQAKGSFDAGVHVSSPETFTESGS